MANSGFDRICLAALALALAPLGCARPMDVKARPPATQASNAIARIPGLIALWNFERTEGQRWTSVFDPRAVDRAFPVNLRRIGDPRSYRLDDWPYQDAGKLVIEDGGPLGKAVRFHRGHIFAEVPRAAFDRTPLDISG